MYKLVEGDKNVYIGCNVDFNLIIIVSDLLVNTKSDMSHLP